MSDLQPMASPWERRVLLTAPVLFVLVFGVLARFAFPAADDFTFALGGRSDPWRAQAAIYLGWCGRYTANALLTVLPQWLDLVRWYWLVPVAHLGLLLAGWGALAAVLLGGEWCRHTALVAGGAIFAVYLAGLETVYEGFYWFSGAVTYQLGLGLGLLTLALLFWDADARRRPWRVAGIILAGAVGGGTSETVSLLWLALLLGLALWRWRVGGRDLSLWLLATAVWAVATVVVVAAPGNGARAAVMFHYRAPSAILQTYGIYVADRWLHWLLTPAALGLALLWFAWLPRFTDRFPALRPVKGRHLLLAGVLWVGLPAFGALPSCLITEGEPMPRVGNVLYAFFLIGLLGFVAVAGAWLWQRRPLVEREQRHLRWFGLALLLGGLLAAPTSTFPRVVADLGWRARSFHRQELARLEVIRQAREQGRTSVELPPLRDPPASLHGYDLESFDWIRLAYARYFGLEEVRIRQRGPQ